MNLLNYVKPTVVYASTITGSTAIIVGGTGDAVALSTSFATGTSSGQTVGGYPSASTGLDMADFEGVLFIANINSASTGAVAATSGIATLYAFGGAAQGLSSTSLSTTFVALQGASISGYSTANFSLWLDVYRPKTRFIQAQVQVASSSQLLNNIIAIQYGAKKEATAPTTTLGTAVSGAQIANFGISVSPGS